MFWDIVVLAFVFLFLYIVWRVFWRVFWGILSSFKIQKPYSWMLSDKMRIQHRKQWASLRNLPGKARLITQFLVSQEGTIVKRGAYRDEKLRIYYNEEREGKAPSALIGGWSRERKDMEIFHVPANKVVCAWEYYAYADSEGSYNTADYTTCIPGDWVAHLDELYRQAKLTEKATKRAEKLACKRDEKDSFGI
jgi:hypothetical protein